jgi:3'(2'), 5'-bisphosphate nucleotidase
MSHERELEAAITAAEQAGRVILDHYHRIDAVADAPANITTDADRQSQEAILSYLRRYFPSDAFCAEESSASLVGVPHDGPRLWIVDPIDGTRGFVKKNGEFSIMVGFVEHGETVVGAVLEPVFRRLTYAAKGQGCWCRDADELPRPCKVSDVADLKNCTLIQSHSRSSAKRLEALSPARTVQTYSAGIKLARVARGEADIYLNTYRAFHDWDICAGHVLVEEAGGRVSGLSGEPIRYALPGNWQRHGLIASNGRLHDAALAALPPDSGSEPV